MGYFWDFITGGNIKVASSSLARLHHDISQNHATMNQSYTDRLGAQTAAMLNDVNQVYIDTYCARVNSMLHMAVAGNNAKGTIIYEMARQNMIQNYVYLVALDLNVFAAPKLTRFEETFSEFNTKITRYLSQKGLPPQYVTGDNRHITQEAATAIERGRVS